MTQTIDALAMSIDAALRAQRFDEAAELLYAACERDPENAGLNAALAGVLVQLGRTIPARRYYQRALARDPGNSEARVQLARLLAARGDTAEAIAHYRQAIKWRAEATQACTELAALLAGTGDNEGAIELYARVAEREPESADALLNLGSVLMPAGRFAEAERCFRQLLARSPQDATHLARLAASLAGQQRFDEALDAYTQASRLAPDLPEAARGVASALWARGERIESIAALREFLARHPADSGAQHDLAARLELIGRLDEAYAHYAAALALAPDSEELQTEVGLFELREGDQSRGWSAVWATAQRNLLATRPDEDTRCDLALPNDLRGRSVLLKSDREGGDELFFLRYAAELRARGARVIFQPSTKIHALLRQRAIGIDQLVGAREAAPECDYRVFLSALPLALARFDAIDLPQRARSAAPSADPARIGGAIPVWRRVFWPVLPPTLSLEPNPARLKFWRERLAEMGAPPYVLLTWRAGAAASAEETMRGAGHAEKHAPADALCRTLGALPGTLVSLQREPRPGEIDALSAEAGRPVHDCARANDDLEDALALVALADDYVCVSNTNTHLRACAGRTARVLVPWPAHGRWMARGAESPWFSGFRVYRQRPDGGWSAALAQLAADLRAAKAM